MPRQVHLENIKPQIRDLFLSCVSDGSTVNQKEARHLIQTAQGMNEMDQGRCCGPAHQRGTRNIVRLVNQNQDLFEQNSIRLIREWVQGGGRTDDTSSVEVEEVDRNHDTEGKKIIDWKAEQPLWYCHWFPMRATNPDGGDPINNLYAKGGALDKYDRAFTRRSREYELQNNSVPHNDLKRSWFGHCDKAALVSILLKEPRRSVHVNGVQFSPNDVAGLLCLVVDNLTGRVDFRGERYYGRSDDQNDPAPQDFLKCLREWTEKGGAFVMDTDREEQVWNYPYDRVEVFESKQMPMEVDGAEIPTNGVRYYEAFLSGTGYEKQQHHYKFWIQYNEAKKPIAGGWIQHEQDPSISPDFLWKPEPAGDLSTEANWDGTGTTNPHIYAQEVFEIYQQSI